MEMGYLSRKPTSNDPPRGREENPWGPQDDVRDDISVLLSGEGMRCTTCRRVVLNEFLRWRDDRSYCPDHA